MKVRSDILSAAVHMVVASLTLTGCAAGIEEVSAANRGGLFTLRTGQSRAEVVQIMGTDTAKVSRGVFRTGAIPNPYCSESHQVAGHAWEILHYATNIRNTDGVLTDEEITPVVLKDGVLDGWGWGYFQRLAQEYDIQRTCPRPPGGVEPDETP